MKIKMILALRRIRNLLGYHRYKHLLKADKPFLFSPVNIQIREWRVPAGSGPSNSLKYTSGENELKLSMISGWEKARIELLISTSTVM